MNRLIALAFAGAFLLAGGANAKDNPVVAGDSICVGLAEAAGLQFFASVGAPAREVASQLMRIPEGKTVIVCAGTNDAAGGLHGFERAVDRALAEAKRRRQTIIWVGPIGTPLWWDRYADRADTWLALRAPHYVSLRAIGWRRGERAGDCIHLTRKGALRLWSILQEKLK